MAQTKIKIWNINGVQPDNFQDFVITPSVPKFQGMQETRLLSDKDIRLKDDNQYYSRPIQDIFYPKYKVQFIVNGNYWVENIRYARKAQVIQEGKRIHEAEVIDITREFLGDDAYSVNMTYYDKSIANVVDNMKSDFIFNSDQDFEYYRLQYSSSDYLYTRVSPVLISPSPEQVVFETNDVNVLTKSVLKQTRTYTFYISGEDLEKFQSKYHYYACSIDGNVQADILPDPNISEVGWDLYKLEIDFIHNVQKYYK